MNENSYGIRHLVCGEAASSAVLVSVCFRQVAGLA